VSDEEKTTVTDDGTTDLAEKNKDAFKRVCPHGHYGYCPHRKEVQGDHQEIT